MPKKVKVSRKTYKRFTLIIALVIIFITILVSYYLVIYKAKQPITAGLPTPKPTATPTPTYLPFLKRPANYVGQIIEISSPTRIVMLRDDKSKLILNLKPEIPIYVVRNTNSSAPQVETFNQSILKVDDTISVYTKDNAIVAIFLFND